MSTRALNFGNTLWRAQAVLQQRLDERLGDWHGLNLGDYQLLSALESQPHGLVLRALAITLLQAPAVTLRQLLPMEKTGLLERAQGLVRLRPAGRQLLAEARRTTEAVYAQALQALGADASTLADCQQLLERLALPARGKL
ncbi:MAG: hypothetical protein JO200_02780 [Comamonas sp.]|nr:hypothetical protein [Comamonas sp.]